MQHLTSVSRLVFLPSHIFPVRCRVDLQTITVYQRGKTSKITSAKVEKVEKSSDDLLILAIVDNDFIFFLKSTLQKKIVLVAIFPNHLWHAAVLLAIISMLRIQLSRGYIVRLKNNSIQNYINQLK